jgi:hypothetical protein
MKASSPTNTVWPLTAVDKKLMTSLGNEIFRSLVNYETAIGNLDPAPENISALIRTLKKRISAGEMEWRTATDFRSSLLKLAREAKSEEDWEMSCLYYGTWLEHQMNNLIHFWLMKKGGNDRYAETLMKESGVRGKLLWLHLCITGRVVPIKQLNRLIALAQRRNQFVHYKWTMRDIDAEDDHYQRAAEGGIGIAAPNPN